ncbi:GAF domain-containing protein [Isoptericola sp. AK164]|uniref:sensor histidine kinase n=1 Tax=Isoptericola sp. AK164 TaxID=3024246 RepID=UPI002418A446|nr:GAF domain-containing protein [Isoptericola sp. AK164]
MRDDDVDLLLAAVVSVGRGLDLESTLQRLVQAATDVVDARYGALGVLGDDRQISRFLTVGLTPEEIEAIGPYPRGKGLLGELIRHPDPLRLADMSSDARSVGFPAHHPPMRSFLGVPLRVRGRPFGNLYLTEKRGGGEFTARDEHLAEALASAASVAVENARLYSAARLRERWARGNHAISREIAAGSSPQSVMDVVAQEAMSVAEADTAVLATRADDADQLVIRSVSGAGVDGLVGTTLPTQGTFAADAYISGQPVMTADAATDDRTTLAFRPVDIVGPLAAVPLGGPGQTIGVLSVGRRRHTPPFSSVVIDSLQAFAAQTAVALELAQRRLDGERLAVVRERNRIARDLHDLAIQRLYATGLSLQGVGRRLDENGPPADADRVGRAVDDLDETISLIRTTIRGLRDADEPDRRTGVRARLIAESDAARRSLGFPPALHLSGPIDAVVPGATADQLVAVLREALSNVARHAAARHVTIDVTATDGHLVLSVRDDGHGIPDGVTPSGLRNLEQRAVDLGGSFDVETASSGTALRWQVPLGA